MSKSISCNFVYPDGFSGEKSGKFQFEAAPITNALRRESSLLRGKYIAAAEQMGDLPLSEQQLRGVESMLEFECNHIKLIASRQKFTADEIELFDSEWNSEFWSCQHGAELRALIDQFRDLAKI